MAKKILDITNQIFGELVVLEKAEKGCHGKLRWKCRCNNCGNEVVVNGSDLKNNKIHSCGCIDEKNFKSIKKKKIYQPMTEQEKKEWDELYEYVRSEIMNMSSNQSLSRFMVVRLKGLLSGKFVENYNIENVAKYSLRTVINTFKYCSLDIKKAVTKKHFDTDEYKFNYIMTIVEKNIRTVDERMKFAKKKDDEFQSSIVESIVHDGASYQRKTKDVSSKFDDLW